MRSYSVVMLGALLISFSGCGGADRPKLVKVTGQVTLNGEPLSGAAIMLQRDPPDPQYGRPSRGMTDLSGNFSGSTYAEGDGIPPGKYKVAITKLEVPEEYNSEGPEENQPPVKYITPFIYSDPERSGLTVEITSKGITPAVIELEGQPELVRSRAQRRADDP